MKEKLKRLVGPKPTESTIAAVPKRYGHPRAFTHARKVLGYDRDSALAFANREHSRFAI